MDTLNLFRRIKHRGCRITATSIGLFCLLWTQALTAESIEVQITTHLGDQQVFRAGDNVSFLVSLNQDAYLHVIYQDASGQLTQILPNSQLSTAHYKAGQFISIPSNKDNFEFFISAPFGEEIIWIIATKQSLFLPMLVPSEKLSNGMFNLYTDMADIKTVLRGKANSDKLRYRLANLKIKTEK